MHSAMKNGQICFSLRNFLAISSAIQKIASDCGCDAVVHLAEVLQSGFGGGRRPTPSTWGPPETTLRVSVSAWCQRRCASCLRYDMVCCMRVFLSWFRVPVCSLNMRVGQVSEHSSGVQPCFMDNPCFCVLGVVPGAGSSSNSRCSGPLGRPPEERGGPWAPPPLLFHTTKSCCGSLSGYLIAIGKFAGFYLGNSWLGKAMIPRKVLPFKLWPFLVLCDWPIYFCLLSSWFFCLLSRLLSLSL